MTLFKRRYLAVLAMLLSASGTTTARAGDSGWYAGVNEGIADYSGLIEGSEQNRIGSTFNNHNTTNGFSILGGYQFNNWASLEVSHFDLRYGSADFENSGQVYETVRYKLSGESVDMVFSSSTQGWGVFGRVGVTSANIDEPSAGNSFRRDLTNTSTIVDFGAGVSYGMSNGWGFRVGLTQYHNPGNGNNLKNTGKGDVDFLYLGALYRF